MQVIERHGLQLVLMQPRRVQWLVSKQLQQKVSENQITFSETFTNKPFKPRSAPLVYTLIGSVVSIASF